MKGKIASLIAGMIVGAAAVTHSIAQSPPGAATQAAASDSGLVLSPPPRKPPEKTLEFPLGEGVGRGDFITLPVKIGGKEHLFVVDSGFSLTVIDTALAQSLKETIGTPVSEVQIMSLYGATVKLPLYHPPALEAGGQRLKCSGIPVAAKDMELIREGTGRPVEGILGMDVLSQYVLRLDFRRHVWELIDPADFQAPTDKAMTPLSMVLTPTSNLGIVLPFAGLKDMPVVLDTGDHNVGSITRDTLKRIPPAEIGETTSYAAVDASGNVQAKGVVIKRKWSIAGTVFENTRLTVGVANSIGLRTMADFVVTFDFPRMQVYLESIRDRHPSELPTLEFGIALKDGKLIVRDLVAGEKAKFLDIQLGDQLLAVDGKDIAKTELWALREQLQKAKAPVIRLQRDGQTHEVTLHHEEPPPPATAR